MTFPEPISTSRTLIRRFFPTDGPGLFDCLSRPEVVRFEPYDVFSMEEACAEAARRSNDPSFYAVCRRKDGAFMGSLYLCKGDFSTFELGYVFGLPFQKQGYATESAAALLQYAFSWLGARRITARCCRENTPSWKLMERLGMRREGLLLENIFFKTDPQGNPIWFDTYEYAILKREWKGLSRALFGCGFPQT